MNALDFRGSLVNEVIPFWERAVDEEYGGYFCDIDELGNRMGNGGKHIVTMCRQIYTFSLGHRLTGNQAWLEAAQQGVEFFLQHFLDQEYGGFVRSTNRQGEVADRSKSPYGEYFAIYALAEYFRASGDKAALGHAADTYDLLEKHDWDHARGGYYQELNDDWSIRDDNKSVGHALHALEAVSNMLASTGDSRYLDRLISIVDVLDRYTWDRATGCQYETYTADWERFDGKHRGLVGYGHTLECSAFVQLIAAYTGNTDHMQFARRLLSWALRHGYDDEHGGIYFFGYPNGGVVNSDKMWWVQSEALSSLSTAYRLTGDDFYLGWMEHLAEFIFTKQRDERVGEWHSLLYANGTVRDGRKGWASPEFSPVPAKGGYHEVQGLFHAARNQEYIAAHGFGVPAKDERDWADLAL